MARVHMTENHKDTDIAQRLAAGLSRSGHNVSLDRNYLIPGHEWQRELRQALLAADGLIAVLSENSVDGTKVSSQWIAADIGAARAMGKFLIPVIIGDDVPFPALVSDIYAVRLGSRCEQELERGVREIDEAIRAHIERREKATTLFLPPGYDHLAASVTRFREDAPYEKSVFVMMKFPDPTMMQDRHSRLLGEIWEVKARYLNAKSLSFFEVGFSEVSKPASAAALPRMPRPRVILQQRTDRLGPALRLAPGSLGTSDTSTTSDSHPAPCCSRLWQNGGCCTPL